MKYLTDYIKDRQTELFNKCGVFFAFSSSQFKENMDKVKDNHKINGYEPGDKWMDFGGGFVLSKHFDKFCDEHEKIVNDGMAQDIKENTLEGVILRELANHEFCITYDITDTWEAIEHYPGIKKEYVEKLSRNKNFKINHQPVD